MMRSTALDPAVLRPGARHPLPLLYRLFRAPARRLLERVFDLAVDGLEHLPATGPYIVAANHHNYLDGVVLGAVAPEPIRFIVMPRVWRAAPLHPLFPRHFGPPRRFLPDGAHGRRTARQSVTQRIMDDIAALLS